MDTTRAQEALRIARELAQQAKSATDLHNAFFGIGGRFGELFPTRADREAFAKTPEYQEIVRLRAALPQRERRRLEDENNRSPAASSRDPRPAGSGQG